MGGGIRRAVLLVVLVVASVLPTAGCVGERPAAAEATFDLAAVQALLDTRAAAVMRGDPDLFLSTIDTADETFVNRQRRWFANMRDLPWETVSYTVLAAEWPDLLRSSRWADDVVVPRVELTTRLHEFDDAPVRTLTGFAVGEVGHRLVVISDRTGAGTVFPGSTPDPWELTRVHPVRAGGVLLLFDRDTLSSADAVVRAVEDGVAAVRRTLPFEWAGHAVGYVFADQRVVDSFRDVPGGRITHLGAMTFPVRTEPGGGEVAGIRFTILPSSLRAGGDFLTRITRHELTHVALGPRLAAAPTWVVEGVAEYVANLDVAPAARQIAQGAVARARRDLRLGVSLPESAGFNGADQDWNYALSWMACDHIASWFGEPVLWQMVLGFDGPSADGHDGGDQAVVQRVLGVTADELARAAAERIVAEFG